ncbi:MAG: hypothetical protein OHK0024_01640 [Thalassobaculales bacterium]
MLEITRRGMLGGTAALALAPGMGLLPGAGRAQGLKKLTYVSPFGYLVAFAPDLVAKAGGYFAREGLDVDVQGGKGSAVAVQQVLSGQAQVCRTGGIDAMKAIANQDAPIRIVATINQGSPFFVVSKADKPIRGPKEMVGKTIGVVSIGGATENLLDAMVADAGLDIKSVARQAVGDAPGSFGLVEAGRIDAYMCSIGTLTGLQGQKLPIHSWNTDEYAPVPGQVYVAQTSTIEKDPDSLIRYFRAVNRAVLDIMADSTLDQTLKHLSAFEIRALATPEVAKADLRANFELWLGAGRDNLLRNVPERYERARALLAKVGVVKPGKGSDLYTNALVEKALA